MLSECFSKYHLFHACLSMCPLKIQLEFCYWLQWTVDIKWKKCRLPLSLFLGICIHLHYFFVCLPPTFAFCLLCKASVSLSKCTFSKILKILMRIKKERWGRDRRGGKKVESPSLLLSWSLGKKKKEKRRIFFLFNTHKELISLQIFSFLRRKFWKESGFFIFFLPYFSFLKKFEDVIVDRHQPHSIFLSFFLFFSLIF